MGPNPAERGHSSENPFNRPLSRRSFVVAGGTAAATAAVSSSLLPLYNRLIPNRPPVAEAAEVKAAGVELLGSVASSPDAVAFIYKAEDGKNYAARAGLKDGKVEANRLLAPIENPQSIGISRDGMTVVVGGEGKVVIATDGGKTTWKTYTLPSEYKFVDQVVPVETIDQNPNRPVAVIAYNVNTGNPDLIMIYPDGAVLPVTNMSFNGFTSGIHEEGGKYVTFQVEPNTAYASRYEVSRNGSTATIEEKRVPFATGVVADSGASEVIEDGKQKLLVPTHQGREEGMFTDPLNSTRRFMASESLFFELANVYAYGTDVKDVVKQDDANSVYALIEVTSKDTASSVAKKFPAIVKFDLKDPSIRQRIPVKVPDGMQGGEWSFSRPMIIQSGTDKSMVIIANSSSGEQRFLSSKLDDNGMTFGILPDVRVLQVPPTKIFVPVALDAVKN